MVFQLFMVDAQQEQQRRQRQNQAAVQQQRTLQRLAQVWDGESLDKMYCIMYIYIYTMWGPQDS